MMDVSSGSSSLIISNMVDENSFQKRRQRQRRRSNSSSNILAHINAKAVRSPWRDSTYNDIPRPPRLAYDTTEDYTQRISMTPPSRREYNRQEYNRSEYDLTHAHTFYKNEEGSFFSSTGSKKSFGNVTNNGRRGIISDQALESYYNERIEKATSFDDDKYASYGTLSCSSEFVGEDETFYNINDMDLSHQVFLLCKEIDAVKINLAGLQKDYAAMLKEKQQIEQQYKETKSQVTKSLETSTNDLLSYNELLNAKMEKLSLELASSTAVIDNDNSDVTSSDDGNGEWPAEYADIMTNCVHQANELELLQAQLEKSKQDFRMLMDVKKNIELTLEAQEREYMERIRQCEAVTIAQSGMIDQMEKLLKDLEGKMDKLINEKIQQQSRRQQSSKISSTSDDNRGHRYQPTTTAATGLSLNSNVGRKKPHRLQEIVTDQHINSIEDCSTSELMPTYCLSPPQSRQQSYTNPISLFTDEERVRHKSRFCLAKRWIEDDEVSICQHNKCNLRFNLWNRRHHCRRCGNIFCNTHSAYSMLLFPDGSEDWGGIWSRVCERCFKDT